MIDKNILGKGSSHGYDQVVTMSTPTITWYPLSEEEGLKQCLKSQSITFCTKCIGVGEIEFKFSFKCENRGTHFDYVSTCTETRVCSNCEGGGFVCCLCRGPERACECGGNSEWR